jgi:type II secretory pathway component PulJ
VDRRASSSQPAFFGAMQQLSGHLRLLTQQLASLRRRREQLERAIRSLEEEQARTVGALLGLRPPGPTPFPFVDRLPAA